MFCTCSKPVQITVWKRVGKSLVPGKPMAKLPLTSTGPVAFGITMKSRNVPAATVKRKHKEM